MGGPSLESWFENWDHPQQTSGKFIR